MTMTPGVRKLMLTAHVTSSVGWLGALGGFFVLAVAGLASEDPQTVRAAYPAMDLIARFVIVPLALASVLTGLVQALGTPWGLFRHYWVLIKFVVTVVAALVLLQKLGLISSLADAATATSLSSTDLREDRMSLVIHAGGGLLVLLVPTVLSIFKPRGMTRYGRRNQATSRELREGEAAPLSRV